MKQFSLNLHCFFVFVGILVSINVKADSWELPKVKTYYSENKEYKLIVTPQIIPDKYYEWSYYKNNKYPQTKKLLRKKEKFMQKVSAQDTILIPCIAELYRINNNDSIQIWRKPLLNDICPTYAIVANDGSSIVTLENWFSKGYGVNVFVVYNENGEAKRTYKLEEISPFPLNDYQRSISSLYWCKEVKYIDNEMIKIIFKTEKNIQKERVYNTKSFEFEE